MAKKDKKEESKEVETVQAQEVNEQEIYEAEAAVEPAPEQVLHLHDAAQRFINGFKEHHWPAIRKYADSLGVGEEAPISQCCEIFRGFGCRLK